MGQIKLRDFIAGTVNEIMDGIIIAQNHAKGIGAKVNPSNIDVSTGTPVLNPPGYEVEDSLITTLNFDIGINVGTDDSGKGGVGLFAGAINVGVSGSISESTESLHRVKFDLLVEFPKQQPE